LQADRQYTYIHIDKQTKKAREKERKHAFALYFRDDKFFRASQLRRTQRIIRSREYSVIFHVIYIYIYIYTYIHIYNRDTRAIERAAGCKGTIERFIRRTDNEITIKYCTLHSFGYKVI
jgi:hypothetical protein